MARTKTSARRSLLDAATSLLAENPRATFLEIAAAAGVGRASLYRHFPSREALIRELSLEAIQATDEAVAHVMSEATSAGHALRLTAEAMVPLGDRYHFLSRIPELDDDSVNAALRRQNNELKLLIQAAQQEGTVDPEMPLTWAVAVFNALTYVAWNSLAEGELDKDSARDHLSRSLLQALAPGHRPRQQ